MRFDHIVARATLDIVNEGVPVPTPPALHRDWDDSGISSALLAISRDLSAPRWAVSGTLREAAAALSTSPCSKTLDAIARTRVRVGALLERHVAALCVAARAGLAATRVARRECRSSPAAASSQSRRPNRDAETLFAEDDAFFEGLVVHKLKKRSRCVVASFANATKAPSESTTSASRGDMATLYFASYAAAVWTSAHAEYLATRLHVEEPGEPSIFTFPCATAAIDLSSTYEKRNAHARSDAPGGRGDSKALTTLLARCTNPGTRGWKDAFCAAWAQKGARVAMAHELQVSLCGMHPQLDPTKRSGWKQRMRTLRVATRAVAVDSDFTGISVVCGDLLKEAIRRMLASTLAGTPASHSALARLQHPARMLQQPPVALPCDGMHSSMSLLASAGRELVHIFQRANVDGAAESTMAMLYEALESVPCKSWVTSWLGKGSASIQLRRTLSAQVGGLWHASHGANVLPLWLLANQNGQRMARLDAPLYDAIHAANAVSALERALNRTAAHDVARRALADHSAALRNSREVMKILSFPLHADVPPRQEFGAYFRRLPAGQVARLLLYARVARANEAIVVVDLGPVVREKQRAALLRRYRCTEEGELPVQATDLCVCCNCRRVGNAHVHEQHDGTPFNELGLISCQVAADGLTMRCARRSSAALRNAATAQERMKSYRVEEHSIADDDAFFCGEERLAQQGQGRARARRDLKNTFDQPRDSISCGANDLLSVPMRGRAVRVFGKWYAHCALCGAITKYDARVHAFGCSPCCMRCDIDFVDLQQRAIDRVSAPHATDNASVVVVDRHLARKLPCSSATEGTVVGAVDPLDVFRQEIDTSSLAVGCIYCHAPCPIEMAATKYRCLRAPLDTSGENANLPPPLRRVWYCGAHFREWLGRGHQVYETNVILAHLAHAAKPVFGAGNLICDHSEGASANDSTRKKRRSQSRSRSRPKLTKRPRHT